MADMAMMEAVAREYGIALYRRYNTDQAAHFLDKAPFTLKRWRREGKQYPRATPDEGRVYYYGIDIVEFMLRRRGGLEEATAETPPGNLTMAAE